jgi:VWFA-related protein
MKRILAAMAVCGAATIAAAQRTPTPASGDLVELDVVVLDREERPVTDLRKEDFQIKEDGRVVDVKTFAQVTALGSTEPDDARIVTLLMDDIGVPMTGTAAMQAIAQVVLSPAGQGDEVSVVRLSSRGDEAFGDFATARDRIDGYRGGIVPFSRRDTPETVLKAVAKIAGQLAPMEHRRKTIICLGLDSVCNPEEPVLGNNSPIWASWVAAIRAAARANVSVYSVDPTGLNQRSGARFVGLLQLTGGERFGNSNNFVQPAEAIWRQSSRYYLLGYWPDQTGNRELHSIDVKVGRKDVHVRARRAR